MKFELPKGATCWPDWIDKVELLDFDEAVAIAKLGITVYTEPTYTHDGDVWLSWTTVEKCLIKFSREAAEKYTRDDYYRSIFFLVK